MMHAADHNVERMPGRGCAPMACVRVIGPAGKDGMRARLSRRRHGQDGANQRPAKTGHKGKGGLGMPGLDLKPARPAGGRASFGSDV